MQIDTNEERERRSINMFGILLPSLPSLMLRFSGTFLKLKKDAQKARKIFKKELIKQGLEKHAAEELTEIYMKGSHIRNFIQNIK